MIDIYRNFHFTFVLCLIHKGLPNELIKVILKHVTCMCDNDKRYNFYTGLLHKRYNLCTSLLHKCTCNWVDPDYCKSNRHKCTCVSDFMTHCRSDIHKCKCTINGEFAYCKAVMHECVCSKYGVNFGLCKIHGAPWYTLPCICNSRAYNYCDTIFIFHKCVCELHGNNCKAVIHKKYIKIFNFLLLILVVVFFIKKIEIITNIY